MNLGLKRSGIKMDHNRARSPIRTEMDSRSKKRADKCGTKKDYRDFVGTDVMSLSFPFYTHLNINKKK